MIQTVHGEYRPPENPAATGGSAQPGSQSADSELDGPLDTLVVLVLLVAACCRRWPWLPPLAGAATGFLVWLGFRDVVASPWGLVFLGSLGSGLLAWLISWFAALFGTAGGGGSSRDSDWTSSSGGGSSGGGSSGGGSSGGGSSGGGFSGGGGSFGGGGASGRW